MKAPATSVAPRVPARTQPRYIASCAASGPGGQLCQCETLRVILLRKPLPIFHEVALHVSRKRDRAAEAERSEMKEIEEELPQCAGERFGTGRGRSGSARRLHALHLS